MKSKFLLSLNRMASLAGLSLAGVCPGTAQLAGQYGILDVTANGGINPNTGVAWVVGDQYRLAFYTAEKFDAQSPDPAVHNARVTAQAQLNPALAGSTWTAIITTTTTGAQANTGTEDLTDGAGIGGAGFPVYAMDGTTAIARNNADIWNNWSNPFDNDAVIRIPAGTGAATQNVHFSPFLDQYGLGDSGNVHGEQVWTGSNSNGTPLNGATSADQRVGSVDGVEGSVGNTNWGSSNANNTARVWNRGNQNNTTNVNSFYALSDPLTVIVGGATDPFALSIAPAPLPDTGYTLGWPSKEGKRYRLRSSADLEAAVTTWNIVEEDIVSTAPENSYTIELVDSKLFYVLEEYSAP
jgi:hypothetical protein